MTTDTKLAYRPNEAAKATGLGRDTIFHLIATGELRSMKVGGARLIPAAELEAFLARKLDEGQ